MSFMPMNLPTAYPVGDPSPPLLRNRLFGNPSSGQAFEQDAGHGDVNPRFVRSHEALIAFAKTTRVV